jgi:hypothetical protein
LHENSNVIEILLSRAKKATEETKIKVPQRLNRLLKKSKIVKNFIPQGLKPDRLSTAYGAAGSRALSKKAAVRNFSAACKADMCNQSLNAGLEGLRHLFGEFFRSL